MISVLSCLLLGQGALSQEYHITTASEFIQFSKNVNSGSSYSGTTVFLDADIDFSGLSERFEPIGIKYDFQGTFDGQGHTISNLAIKSSSSQFVGLFGNSWGGIIRNVVLDSSCSVVSSCSGSGSALVGGIVGNCYGCTIENTVNVGSVAFTGSTESNLYLGGIAGYLSASSNEVTVKNCANYGSVTHSGTANYAHIGGVVGLSEGSSPNKIFIQNCLNYGIINHNGATTDSLHIGGIAGYAYGTNIIENCVSGGKITSNKGSIGSVVGYIKSSLTSTITTIKHCYWTSNVGNYNVCGEGYLAIDSETKQVTLNTATVDNLNNYATSNSWNKWLLNTNKKPITFKINNGKGFSLSTQLILLPDPANTKTEFRGWFTDSALTEKFTVSEVTTETTLYGGWGCFVTFDATGGTVTISSKIVTYDTPYGELPTPERTGHTFTGWYTEKSGGTKVTPDTKVATPSDHTLYAHWEANTYTVRFMSDGQVIKTEALEYNAEIVYPENPTKTGYTFVGWNPEPKRVPDYGVTITAVWTVNTYNVAFNATGGTVTETSKYVVYDSIYGELPTPERAGYRFIGWFTATTGGTKVTPDTKVTTPSDHTLYAHWEASKYTITFDFGNGTKNEVTLSYGEEIVYPENPTKTGYTFSKWEPNPETVPANDITLKATFHPNIYTVTFNATGGIVSPASKTVTFDEPYGDLPIATKTENVFLWWYLMSSNDGEKKTAVNSETKVATPEDHTLYAAWETNIVTFDFGNGTKIEKQVKYNEAISYPENPTKEGYTFIGWDKNVTVMPAENITITALWRELASSSSVYSSSSLLSSSASSSSSSSSLSHKESKKGDEKGDKDRGSSSSSALIIGITATFVFIVVALIVTVLILFKKNKEAMNYSRRGYELDKPLIGTENEEEGKDTFYEGSGYSRIIAANDNEMNGENIIGKTLDTLFKMYPPSYVRPTMKEALLKAKLSDSQATEVVEACNSAAEFAKVDGKLFEGFTEDDAAAVAMYTYDFGPKEFESNPYRIINTSLVGRNYAGLQRASGILYLVMTALRKLPRVTGMYLYRGVRSEVKMDEDHYHEGNTITWPALSSTSPDMKATKTFLAKGSKTGKATGTLFIIEDGWGYDIQPYSLFPEEAEILLEPERQFMIKSIIEAEGLTFINLKMLDTPLALPQVFGEGK